jgi:predicted lipoprotein with Yx(FWY)xxD motif
VNVRLGAAVLLLSGAVQWAAAAGGDAAVAPKAIQVPAGFTVQTTLLGRVLADHKGRTLYTTPSPPRSADLATWQALEAAWLANPRAPFSTSPLEGGGRQWTFQGRPLYRYARDKDPRDVRGQGIEGGWTAVILEPPQALPPWVTITRVDIGLVFADARGMTVYAPARADRIDKAKTCMADCMARYWRLVKAGPTDAAVGRWSIVVNADGERQWAYDERLLYTHTRDQRPGEMQGNSFAVGYSIGDGFRVILVDSTLPAPGS